MSTLWSPYRSRIFRATVAVLTVCAALWGISPFAGVQPARAQTDSINPLDLLLTNEDAGADAIQVRETQGEDGPSHWARRRWERDSSGDGGSSGSSGNNRGSTKDASSSKDRESHYADSGPLALENAVFVARDLAGAKQVYAAQVAKQPSFPEATAPMNGPFPFPMSTIGDESSALSGCNDCMAKDEIYVHHRVVIRKGPVVTVVYTYGIDKVSTQELATWFAGQAASRIPDDITVAAGSSQANDPAPAASPDASSPAPTNAGQPASTNAGQPSQPQAQAIQARPQDLAIKLNEAGKGAEKKDDKDGSDDKSSWYMVRYERPRTFAGYRAGPVTVFSQVFVARDRSAADQIFQEQTALNEKFPEAKEKVGGIFELKEAGEIGDEGRGLSACNESCTTNKEIYLHKRIVSRVENVVSVVYVWGLANEEGVTDASARYFASIVVNRLRG